MTGTAKIPHQKVSHQSSHPSLPLKCGAFVKVFAENRYNRPFSLKRKE
jgi:hypothetical protein